MSSAFKKYYSILELHEHASEAEIKRQYRRLALRYHPDKNNGDQSKFLEIKEAYEYLTGKKVVPVTAHRSSRNSTTEDLKKQAEERIKKAKQRKKEQEYREYLENERFFQKLTSGWKWKIIRISAVIGLIISTLLIAELFSGHRHENHNIVAHAKFPINGLESDTQVIKIILENGDAYYPEIILNLTDDLDVALLKSPIFHNPRAIVLLQQEPLKEHAIQYDFGAHVYLLIPLFLLPIITILIKRKTQLFTFMYYLSLYLSLPLIIYFLATGNRLVHLITLGYY
ncbi:MAG TPA: J domain-containing protein [Taishania sp.]|nr:J domain-containing protein [Taishania sp.]